MDLKEALGGRIAIVDEALEESLDLDIQRKLIDAMRHYPLAGGKRLRPVMAMLVADAINGTGKRTIPFGVALELTHNFTLIHDDLMDQDDLRRGVITVHKAFDDPTAINAGDVLFARAFEVLTDLECDDRTMREIVRDLAKTVRLIGEGQQSDMDFESRGDVTEADAMKMIELKTAVFFETAARGGALIAKGTPEQVEAMKRYGINVGIGFQLHDDLLDIIGEQEKIGKPKWSDLREGKKTVILLHAIENSSPEDRQTILDNIGREDVTMEELARVVEVLERTGAIDFIKTTTKEMSDKAVEYLNVLPDSEHKDLLIGIADYMVSRDK